jgi:BMFP domain-containing protein YqiC
MSTLALDFTAMMSAAAALEANLAAKDARIAVLEAENATLRDERTAAANLVDEVRRNVILALRAENEALKTRVAALDALLTPVAASAEQQAYDDLSGSVLAEEAYAAAATAQQQHYDDPSGAAAQAEAEQVIDLTGDSEGEAAPAAAPKPKRKAALGTLAWMAYVQHIKATRPEQLAGLTKECEKLVAVKGIRAADPQGYVAFVRTWNEQHNDEAPAPAAQGGGGAAAAPAVAKADAHVFAKLAAVLPEGTPLSLTSTGDRWDGIYTKDGLVFQDKAFKSPAALGRAHAERITERHPKATQPGNSWHWVKIENGAYKGKTLAQAYDAHYA